MVKLVKEKEFGEFKAGEECRVRGEDGDFRFLALVTNPRDEQWAEVSGPLTNLRLPGGGVKRVGERVRCFPVEKIVSIKTKTSSRRPPTTTGEKKVPKSKSPTNCLCGCGGKTKGGRFIPGHDAKLKGRLVQEYRQKLAVGGDVSTITKKVKQINPAWTKYLTEGAAKPAKKAAKRSPATPRKVNRTRAAASARKRSSAKRARKVA